LDWGKLPDFVAVTLLAIAFAAVARRSNARMSALWLTGWVMIALHFAAFMFISIDGLVGTIAYFLGISSLIWAGILFMWASVPYRKTHSSIWMMCGLVTANTFYVGCILFAPTGSWIFVPAAAAFGVVPATVALVNARKGFHPLRWVVVLLYALLSIFVLMFQYRVGNGQGLALNAILFTVYFGCCIHFIYAYRRATSGAFITIAGFFAWAGVFVAGPILAMFLPNLHIESEVWNLPKYIVAVGMILLILEEQIEHNEYLALHDELTGLPNRRLFQDRLASALERARRTGTQAALLLVDLDQFKKVNDTLGHHMGDLLLKRVGSVFLERVRRSDTVARTGGDEFCVILNEPTSREDALQVGTSLIDLLNQPFELCGHKLRIGASVGIAVFPEDATDAEGLCIAADLRMYDFKNMAGRFGESPRPPRPAPVHSVDTAANSQRAG
jgi:diguanylate cyclase (GGDEF)-like protein